MPHPVVRGIRQAVCSATTCLAVLACAGRAHAVGWGPTDFLITGAPNFPDRIGVFDQSFNFKGYLDSSFLGVQGMDFDAQGNLVAVSSLNPEVRVYSPSGTRIGGFTQADSPMLASAGDLKVAPDGDYVLGTTSNGARAFTPQGSFVRQYGDGDSRGVALLPGDRLWSGNISTTVKVFDTNTGAQVGTFAADQQVSAASMQYDQETNTVLVVDTDRDAGGVFERDLSGDLLRQFHVPRAQVTCRSATRGPGGDVFGTTSNFDIDIVDWASDATVVRTADVYPVQITAVRILWAGVVPEPTSTALIFLGVTTFQVMRRARPRGRSGSR